MHKAILLFFFLWLTLLARADEPADTLVVARRSILVVPSLAHQPETSWAGGVAYGLYFKSNDLSRISSVTGGMNYTLLHQFALSITPRLFFRQSRWYLYSNLSLKNYPDYYYGITNQSTSLRQAFRSQNLSVLLQPQIQLSGHLLLGVSLAARTEKIHQLGGTEEQLDDIKGKYGAEGWNPYTQISAGLLVAYDSRDNQFYPQRGFFLKAVAAVAAKGGGSSYSLTDISVDSRKFIPVFSGHIIALQSWINAVWGPRGVPFQLLPTLGGLDLMRGVQRGMYRGNMAAALQSEYRIPLYGRWKAAAFASMGDVMSSVHQDMQLKIAWGAGLRYQLNDARVHLRFDLARNNYDRRWQYYLTASEAF